MPDYTVKADVDTMLRADDKSAIRSAIGVGTTDAPTFLAQTLTGQSLTGTQATSLVDLSATWNTTGTPSALKLNVTDSTASNAAVKLIDLQIAGVSQFAVKKNVAVGGYTSTGAWGVQTPYVSFGQFYGGGALCGTNNGLVLFPSTVNGSFFNIESHIFTLSNTNNALAFGNPVATILLRDGADGILAQRNGVNAQAFRVYDTYDTAGTNYERATFGFPTGTNTLRIGTEQAGTGTAQPIEFVTGGVVRMSIPATGGLSFSAGALIYSSSGEFSVRGNFLDLQAAGAAAGAYIRFIQRGRITPIADGVFQLSNDTNNGFTRLELGATNLGISRGTGSPEGIVTALVGSLYIRTDGGASTTLYVKESGTGNTGWVAK